MKVESFFYFLHITKNIILKLPIVRNLFLKLESKLRYPFFKKDINKLILYKLRHNQTIFNGIIAKIRKYENSYNLKDKVILEIGPGNTLLLAIIFILNGAKKVYLIDRFKQIYKKKLNNILFDCYLKKYLENSHSQEIFDFNLIKNKIIYFNNDAIENIEKIRHNSIDIIFSNAVLEHVFDLNFSIKKINELLKNGGYTYHYVDLRDHFHIKDKCYLDFLKYPHRFYKIIGGENRIRYSQYIQLFNKFGFKILEISRNKIKSLSKIEKIKRNIHKNFRNLSVEDLSIIDFYILAKKSKKT